MNRNVSGWDIRSQRSRNRHLVVLFFLFLAARTGLADGKIYARESVPPGMPYQRALIFYQEGKETLVLQSKFESQNPVATNAAMGWVVPVPSMPELASMTAEDAWMLFIRMGLAARPTVTQLGPTIAALLVLVVFVACVGSLVLALLSFVLPSLKSVATPRRMLIRVAVYGGISCILAAIIVPSFVMARGLGEGVEVLRSEQVGIYDAKIIKSPDSAELVAWLNGNGFVFTESDTPVLDQYIRSGWCFVVAKVRPEEAKGGRPGAEGLMDPLILRFAAPSPIYPLALTATVGTQTEVLIYFLSDRKMACGERLKLLFAGKFDGDLGPSRRGEAPSFRPWEESLSYLCKFKGRLTPEQMRTDLAFLPAVDNTAYREHIIKW